MPCTDATNYILLHNFSSPAVVLQSISLFILNNSGAVTRDTGVTYPVFEQCVGDLNTAVCSPVNTYVFNGVPLWRAATVGCRWTILTAFQR